MSLPSLHSPKENTFYRRSNLPPDLSISTYPPQVGLPAHLKSSCPVLHEKFLIFLITTEEGGGEDGDVCVSACMALIASLL